MFKVPENLKREWEFRNRPRIWQLHRESIQVLTTLSWQLFTTYFVQSNLSHDKTTVLCKHKMIQTYNSRALSEVPYAGYNSIPNFDSEVFWESTKVSPFKKHTKGPTQASQTRNIQISYIKASLIPNILIKYRGDQRLIRLLKDLNIFFSFSDSFTTDATFDKIRSFTFSFKIYTAL